MDTTTTTTTYPENTPIVTSSDDSSGGKFALFNHWEPSKLDDAIQVENG